MWNSFLEVNSAVRRVRPSHGGNRLHTGFQCGWVSASRLVVGWVALSQQICQSCECEEVRNTSP